MHPEHGRIEDRMPRRGILKRGSTDGRLAELGLGDLEGDVGASEGRTRKTELLLDEPRVGEDVRAVNLDTLDGREGARSRVEDTGLGELGDDLA